jgi:hypothetical protein
MLVFNVSGVVVVCEAGFVSWCELLKVRRRSEIVRSFSSIDVRTVDPYHNLFIHSTYLLYVSMYVHAFVYLQMVMRKQKLVFCS